MWSGTARGSDTVVDNPDNPVLPAERLDPSCAAWMSLTVEQLALALAQAAALGAAVALAMAPVICPEPHLHHSESGATLVTEGQLAEQLALETDDMDGRSGLDPEDTTTEPHYPASPGHEHARLTYGMSLLFALLGATLLSVGRLKDERIPHEAVIGSIFVVCAALSVLILSKAPHGHEKSVT